MRNLLFTITYDGTNYHGWQIQENALTVQEVFQNAFKKVTGERGDMKACSRTDTGVHAREFCVSVKTESKIVTERFPAAMNHWLPEDVAVKGCKEAPLDFHARYSCKGKEYSYEIWNNPIREPFLRGRALHYWYPIDEVRLKAAAGYYVGAHDFTSFCTLDKRERGDMVRRVTKARVERRGDMVLFTVAADGFLYNMVRIMAGGPFKGKEGGVFPGGIPGVKKGRGPGKGGAPPPPPGLYLNRVFY